MDPNIKLVLDQLSGLNRHFDDPEAGLNRCFNELEASLSDRSRVVDTRIADISRRLCDLEAAPTDPQVNAVDGRLASLEASFTHRDADIDARLADLESLHAGHIADECIARVESLEAKAPAHPARTHRGTAGPHPTPARRQSQVTPAHGLGHARNPSRRHLFSPLRLAVPEKRASNCRGGRGGDAACGHGDVAVGRDDALVVRATTLIPRGDDKSCGSDHELLSGMSIWLDGASGWRLGDSSAPTHAVQSKIINQQKVTVLLPLPVVVE